MAKEQVHMGQGHQDREQGYWSYADAIRGKNKHLPSIQSRKRFNSDREESQWHPSVVITPKENLKVDGKVGSAV